MKLFFKKPSDDNFEYIETCIECKTAQAATEEIKRQIFIYGRVFLEASNYDTIEILQAILYAIPNVDKYFIAYLVNEVIEMKKNINELSDALDFAAKERDRENDKIHDIYKKIQDVLDYVEKKAED